MRFNLLDSQDYLKLENMKIMKFSFTVLLLSSFGYWGDALQEFFFFFLNILFPSYNWHTVQ